MPDTQLMVRNGHSSVIGHVRNFGCENHNCFTSVVNGKKWHAIPSGFGITLPDYHFRSADEAIQALHEVWDS